MSAYKGKGKDNEAPCHVFQSRFLRLPVSQITVLELAKHKTGCNQLQGQVKNNEANVLQNGPKIKCLWYISTQVKWLPTWVSHHSRINPLHAIFLSCLIIFDLTLQSVCWNRQSTFSSMSTILQSSVNWNITKQGSEMSWPIQDICPVKTIYTGHSDISLFSQLGCNKNISNIYHTSCPRSSPLFWRISPCFIQISKDLRQLFFKATSCLNMGHMGKCKNNTPKQFFFTKNTADGYLLVQRAR